MPDPNQTVGLPQSLNESEMAENIAWWTDLRDQHAAKGQQIAVRRCQEEIDLLKQELPMPGTDDANQTADDVRLGLDALRYLLNISDQSDQPKSRIGTLMDRTFDSEGRPLRQRLERLWEALSTPNPTAETRRLDKDAS